MESVRDFDGVQVFPLYVFDQRQFKQMVSLNSPHQGWDFAKAGQTSGSPAPLAGN
jgi:hypothetical protein